jgi:hypothetical protein
MLSVEDVEALITNCEYSYGLNRSRETEESFLAYVLALESMVRLPFVKSCACAFEGRSLIVLRVEYRTKFPALQECFCHSIMDVILHAAVAISQRSIKTACLQCAQNISRLRKGRPN